MPTSNVVTTQSGTAFSVNVAPLNLSSDLTLKDFVVLINGVVAPLINFTKQTQSQIGYSGTNLVSATLEFRRNTPTSVVTTAQFGSRLRSEDWNNELDRISRRAEEYALNGVGAGSLVSVALPQNDAFGVIWSTDTIFPPSRKSAYDIIVTKANINNPTFTGTVIVPTVLTSDDSLKAAPTSYVKALLVSYAPLASPTFSGTPVLPAATVGVTQTAGDSTTKLATTQFVARDFAPLASPSLTGTPSAPTPAIGDNTTKVATTAFVNTAISTSNRPLVDAGETTGGQTLTHAAYTILTYNTEITDTDNAFLSSTFTVPTGKGGYYSVSATLTINGGCTLLLIDLFVNGVAAKRISASQAATDVITGTSGSTIVKLNASDVLTCRCYQANTTTSTRAISNAGTAFNYVVATRLNT